MKPSTPEQLRRIFNLDPPPKAAPPPPPPPRPPIDLRNMDIETLQNLIFHAVERDLRKKD